MGQTLLGKLQAARDWDERIAKVFVAGAFLHRKEIHDKYIRHLEEYGIEITHDWTQQEKRVEGGGKSESDTRRDNAILDADGVMDAQVLVVIMDHPEYNYKGTWVEIGVAIGAGIPVLVLYMDAIGDRIYLEHPEVSLFRSFDKLCREGLGIPGPPPAAGRFP